MSDNDTSNLFSPLNDFAFKALFGRDEDYCYFILIDFLNTVLFTEDDSDFIKELVYLNPFNLKEHQKDKLSVLE